MKSTSPMELGSLHQIDSHDPGIVTPVSAVGTEGLCPPTLRQPH